MIILVIIIVIISLLFILGAKSRNGVAPGLVNGKLSACSKKPNCVCSEIYSSEINSKDTHYIQPIMSSDIAVINSIIENMGGVLVKEKNNYFSYQFTSRIFGFVDDFEVRYDKERKIIHLRSASRVGRSDLGANRKRVEDLKHRYQKKINLG